MNSFKTAFAAAFALFAFAAAAQADTLEVKVPFAFTIGTHQMPAGAYRVERDPFASQIVLLRGEHGNTAQAFVQTTPGSKGNPAGEVPALVFLKYENENRLAAIWESGAVGHEIAAPHAHARVIGRIILQGNPRS